MLNLEEMKAMIVYEISIFKTRIFLCSVVKTKQDLRYFRIYLKLNQETDTQ